MLGAFLGSWGCYFLAKRLEQHKIRVISWGALISSAIMLLVAVNHLPIVTLLLAMLFGVSSAMKNVPQTTLVQKMFQMISWLLCMRCKMFYTRELIRSRL